MIDRIRYTWQLLVLTSILILAGILILPRIHVELSLVVYLLTLVSLTVINLIVYLVMLIGIRKQNKGGIVFMMAGIGIKFLLYLLFILLFWSATKNVSKPFIVTFLALYLVFTFFTAAHLFKSLKNN